MSKIIKTPSNSPIMGRIDTIVNELCPDGVEYVKLGDVCSAVFAGGTPSTSRDDYYDGTIPWIRSGEIDFNRIFNAERNITDLGLANSSAKLIKPFSVVMAMTGATVAKVATVEIETSANQSVCALETNKDNMDYRYLYYYLSAHYHDIKSSAQGALTSLNLQMIKALQIPLPPLSIQQKIVSVLDSFTTLIDKMKQEVEKRKKQMEYYREKLLTFKDDECEWKTLGEIAEIGTGSGNTNEGLEEGLYPFYTRGQEVLRKNTFEYDEEAIITAGDGVGVGKVMHYVKGKYALHQRAYRFKPNEGLSTKYLYYYMQVTFYKYVCGNAVASSVSSLRKPKLQVYPIPVPSLDKQSSIVSTLDKFESYITKLEKMIVLRQKQYEYYREQLLTFR